MNAALVTAGAGAVILALYLLLPLVADYRFPIGPDGPVYTWWTQGASVLGLDAVAPGRPGVPAAALVLGGLLRTAPLETIALLGPVLAAACGLVAGGLLDVALPPRAIRALAGGLLTGAFAAYLAGGWLANLAQVTVFLAALAALATSLSSWRGVIAAATLISAAALAHRLFVAVALLVLVGAAAWMVPDAVARRRRGRPLAETLVARMLIAAGSGALLAGGALAAVGSGAAVPGDTAQDGFFRRLGLRDLLLDRYRERLAGDATRASVPVVMGAGLAAAGTRLLRSGGRADDGRPTRRYLTGILLSWTAVTVIGLVALWATGLGPPNRMLAFAFFLPLAAAIGVDALSRGTGAQAATAMGVAVAGVAVVAFVAVAMMGWFRHAPSFSPQELEAARRAGAVVDRLPVGTPVVILVDTDQPAAAFHVTRFGNVLRMGLPPARLPDVRIAVGAPQDYLEGRPTLTGDLEHDVIARTYLRETAGIRDQAAVLVVREFNPGGAGVTPGAVEAADGVEVVGGPPVPRQPVAVSPAGGLSAPAWVGLSLASLVLLAALGLGWSRWALDGAGPRALLSVAPAVGLAVAILGGFLADRLGPGAGAPWGPAAVVVLAAAGYMAAARALRRAAGS